MSLWRKEGRSVLWISVFFSLQEWGGAEGAEQEATAEEQASESSPVRPVSRLVSCAADGASLMRLDAQIKLMDCCLHQFKSSSSCNQNCCLHLSTLQSAFTSGIITSTWALKVCRVFYSFAKMCKRARTKSIIPIFGSMIRLNTCHSKIKALLTKEEYCAVLWRL